MVTISSLFPNREKLFPADDGKFWRLLSGALGGFGAGTTSTGSYVTREQALRLASVYSCMSLLADLEAMLPLKLFRVEKDGGKEHIRDDEWGYAELLHAPCEGLNGIEFRNLMAWQRLADGNSLFAINRVSKDRVVELMRYTHGALVTDHSRVEKGNIDTGLLKPRYRLNGNSYPTNRVLHFRGPILDPNSFSGVSPIRYAASTIDYATELEKYGTRMQKNGGKPGGALELGPGNLSDERYEGIQKSINESFSEGGTGKVAIIPHGAKWHRTSINSNDAQFIENRKFQRSEIAGIFRVPPHMIGDLEHATFSNIEHQAIQFVNYSLMPWLTRTEATLDRQLLTPDQRAQGYCFKHDVKELLRGDTRARSEFYKVMSMHMQSDEIRRLEDLKDLPDDAGKVVHVPLNMFQGGEDNDPENQNA